MAYIYKITNILNNKIYIGQTIRQPSLRWNEHKSESLCPTSKHGRLYHLHCAIRKYGVDSFIFEVIDECPDNERFRVETKYILKYQSNDPQKGYNYVVEGSGRTPYSSQKIKELWEKGFSRNEIAEILNAQPLTISSRLHQLGVSHEEVVNRKKKEKWSEWQSKPVIQYSLDGTFIKEWNSATECSSYGYLQSAVSNVCRQEQYSAYGFLWKYKDDERNIQQWVDNYNKRNIRHRSKAIQQLDKEGKFIAQYNSAKEAAQSLGIKDKSGICRAARIHGTSCGYRWEYL